MYSERIIIVFILGTLSTLSACVLDLQSESSIVGCSEDRDCPGDEICSLNQSCVPKTTTAQGPSVDSVLMPDADSIEVFFDRALSREAAENLSNYSVSGSMVLESVRADEPTKVEPTKVVLRVDSTTYVRGSSYILSFDDIQDIYGVTASGTATFQSFGSTPDTAAPELLAPRRHETIRRPGNAPTVLLVWGARAGASTYHVQTSLDEDFEDVFMEFLDLQSTTQNIPLPESLDQRLYWRVRSDVMDEGSWSSGSSFEVLGETIFVYCAAEENCDGPSFDSQNGIVHPESGNRSTPYRSISRALNAALSLGVGLVKVARRGDTAAYDERIVIAPGVELLGGYAPFLVDGELNDVRSEDVSGRTRVYSDLGSVVSAITIDRSQEPTLLDGFDVEMGIGEGAPPLSAALSLTNCGENLTISNNTFRVSGSGVVSTAIEISGQDVVVPELEQIDFSGAQLQDNRVELSSDSFQRIGIRAAGFVWVDGMDIVFEGSAFFDLGILVTNVFQGLYQQRDSNQILTFRRMDILGQGGNGFGGIQLERATAARFEGRIVASGYEDSVVGVGSEAARVEVLQSQFILRGAGQVAGVQISAENGYNELGRSVIYGNSIHVASTESGASAVQLNNARAAMSQNTLVAESSGAEQSDAVIKFGEDFQDPDVSANNVIVSFWGGSAVYSQRKNVFTSFQNNAFLGDFGQLFREASNMGAGPFVDSGDANFLNAQSICVNEAGNNYLSASDCESVGPGGEDSVRSDGNILILDALSEHFVTPQSIIALSPSAMAEVSWAPLSTSTISSGAKTLDDALGSPCGVVLTNLSTPTDFESTCTGLGTFFVPDDPAEEQEWHSAPSPNVDFLGQPRSAPNSIGAYEVD